jgi:hypothetical protein
MPAATRRKRYHGPLGDHRLVCRRLAWLLILMMLSLPAGAQVVPLPSFNVDIKGTSVSGLSSGGYMAVQFDVAYSSFLKGAEIT